MKCIICHGEEIGLCDVKEELKIDNNIIYAPVQIPVCGTCGERYYDRKTIRFLETVEQKLKSGEAKVHEVGKVLRYG